ncbi:SRPBCC family protein [Streptomyces sp. J2-1]|uniref:SRPBCC family protein n=1 Tax=Streptomyces corallincola TaxID=2851888 RepID=UPI001C39409A|nr:SRPBCC family protein [Streptomyces corallincola]MBV2353857.1 SRPBCC family protein [Streptomyces corallincola]
MPTDHEGLRIHWPAGFAPDEADYHFQARITVKAAPEGVFCCLADLNRWPLWVPGVTEAGPTMSGGPLALQESFRVRLFGVGLECLVGEWQPGARLGWSGLGPGLHFYHAWTFEPRQDTTVVVTEQTARGATAVTMRDGHPEWENFLRYGWLDSLKQRAEVR